MFEVKGTRVRVLADSRSPRGHRLTTVECRFPRRILQQVRTYGMLEYSVRSNRAVPTRVLLEELTYDPYIPPVWLSAGKGMQPGGPATGPHLKLIEDAERHMRGVVSKCVQQMATGGCSKEQVNDYLHSWAWSWAVVTGTDDAWDHLFRQRCAPDAQNEFQDLANKIKVAFDGSVPKELAVGDWHLPYVNSYERDSREISSGKTGVRGLSAARCARVSYQPFDGVSDPEAEYARAAKLLADEHMSPFGHQAQATNTSGRSAKFLGFNSNRTLMGY